MLGEEECYNGTDRKDWYAVHLAAFIPASISLLCSCYVIYSTIALWNRYKRIGVGARFPMYISICDVLFHVYHGSDHLHSLVTCHTLVGTSCEYVGGTALFFINCQAMWELSLAIFIFRCVYLDDLLYDSGRFDWKLHLQTWSLPLILYFLGWGEGWYGPEGSYWCGVTEAFHHKILNDFLMIVVVVVNMCLYLLVSCKICRTINNKTHVSSDYYELQDSSAKEQKNRMKRTAYYLPTFVLVFIFQWVSYVFYSIQGGRGYNTVPFDFVLWNVAVTNSGGFMNAVVFKRLLRNEKSRLSTVNEL